MAGSEGRSTLCMRPNGRPVDAAERNWKTGQRASRPRAGRSVGSLRALPAAAGWGAQRRASWSGDSLRAALGFGGPRSALWSARRGAGDGGTYPAGGFRYRSSMSASASVWGGAGLACVDGGGGAVWGADADGRVVSAVANWDGCDEWGCASERRRNSDSSRPPLRASRFRTCDRTRVRQRMKFGRTDTDQRRELEVISNEHERVREA